MANVEKAASVTPRSAIRRNPTSTTAHAKKTITIIAVLTIVLAHPKRYANRASVQDFATPVKRYAKSMEIEAVEI